MITNTSQYEFSHGHKPKGRGLWMFEMLFTDGNGSYSTETVQADGTLSEAKRAAWSRIRSEVGAAKSLVEVTVLP
jgi:hypothetical protein